MATAPPRLKEVDEDVELLKTSSVESNLSGMICDHKIPGDQQVGLGLTATTADDDHFLAKNASKSEFQDNTPSSVMTLYPPRAEKIEDAELVETSSVESGLSDLIYFHKMPQTREVPFSQTSATADGNSQLPAENANKPEVQEIEDAEPMETSSIESILSDMIYIDKLDEEEEVPSSMPTIPADDNASKIEVGETDSPSYDTITVLPTPREVGNAEHTYTSSIESVLFEMIYIEHISEEQEVPLSLPTNPSGDNHPPTDNASETEVGQTNSPSYDTMTVPPTPREVENAQPMETSSTESILSDMIYIDKLDEEQEVPLSKPRNPDDNASKIEVEETSSLSCDTITVPPTPRENPEPMETSSTESILSDMIYIDKLYEEEEVPLSVPTNPVDANHPPTDNAIEIEFEETTSSSYDTITVPPTPREIENAEPMETSSTGSIHSDMIYIDKHSEEQDVPLSVPTNPADDNASKTEVEETNSLSCDTITVRPTPREVKNAEPMETFSTESILSDMIYIDISEEQEVPLSSVPTNPADGNHPPTDNASKTEVEETNFLSCDTTTVPPTSREVKNAEPMETFLTESILSNMIYIDKLFEEQELPLRLTSTTADGKSQSDMNTPACVMTAVPPRPKEVEDADPLETSSVKSTLSGVDNHPPAKNAFNVDIQVMNSPSNFMTIIPPRLKGIECDAEPLEKSSAKSIRFDMICIDEIPDNQVVPLGVISTTAEGHSHPAVENASARISEVQEVKTQSSVATLFPPKPEIIEDAELLETSSVESGFSDLIYFHKMPQTREVKFCISSATADGNSQLPAENANKPEVRELEDAEPMETSSIEAILSDMIYIDKLDKEQEVPHSIPTNPADDNASKIEVEETSSLSCDTITVPPTPREVKDAEPLVTSSIWSAQPLMIYIEIISEEQEVPLSVPTNPADGSHLPTDNASETEVEETNSPSYDTILTVPPTPRKVENAKLLDTSSIESVLPEMIYIDNISEEQEVPLSLPTNPADGNNPPTDNASETEVEQANSPTDDTIAVPPAPREVVNAEPLGTSSIESVLLDTVYIYLIPESDDEEQDDEFLQPSSELTEPMLSLDFSADDPPSFMGDTARDELTEFESDIENESELLLGDTARDAMTEFETDIENESEFDSEHNLYYREIGNLSPENQVTEVIKQTRQTPDEVAVVNIPRNNLSGAILNALTSLVDILMEMDMPWGPQDVLRLIEQNERER